MVKQKAVRNFLLEAIKGLSKEYFDELVRIFQLSYLHNSEAIFVDGTNDGGCDIKLYQNKREIKKCVQVTVQKHVETKIKKDLEKVSNMISQYRYSNKFEFYCSVAISVEKIEEYKKFAIDKYDIELDIYDAIRLSQLNCKDVVDYIYSLHQNIILRPEQMNIDKATKTLYDLLANGKDTSDIKNSLVESIIISILYEMAPIELSKLREELEKRLGKMFPDILHSINILKSDQRVIKDKNNDNLLCLSEEEYNNVQEILTLSAKNEKDFCICFTELLSKYKIEYQPTILEELKKLYKYYYSTDIDEQTTDDDTAYCKVFESFKSFLLTIIDNKDNIDSLIADIKKLCESNNYLNKISASESFLSLYKSNQLEQYINQRHKKIYLDTPTFVYLLCAYYGIDSNDWDNPFYRSMKSLLRLREINPDKISFCIYEGYLGEVVGEIQKALHYAKFEQYPFFQDLGETRNTLFNYYNYLSNAELFEEDENVSSFTDFMYNLGLDNLNPNDRMFYTQSIRFLHEVSETYEIEIVKRTYEERYLEIKELYERILLKSEKTKSRMAIQNDINQVLIALQDDDDSDNYVATWDTTIYVLRDTLLDTFEDVKFQYFNLYNPARLSNKIALENFNISESALTNDIFAYADKKYDISNRVKSLLELITPFLKNKGDNKLLKKLSRLRKEQLQDRNTTKGETDTNKNLPIEEIVMLLIPNKERENEDEHILDKFSMFMSAEENADYIIEIINQISGLKNYATYDLTEYFGKIKSIDLSEVSES